MKFEENRHEEKQVLDILCKAYDRILKVEETSTAIGMPLKTIVALEVNELRHVIDVLNNLLDAKRYRIKLKRLWNNYQMDKLGVSKEEQLKIIKEEFAHKIADELLKVIEFGEEFYSKDFITEYETEIVVVDCKSSVKRYEG